MRLMYTKPKLRDLSQGARIAFVRQFRLMTQDDVSDKLRLTGECKRRTMTRYEKGDRNPKEDRTLEIAQILTDREFSFICHYINDFLRQGNYIAIVTEPGGHGNFGPIFNNQLAKLNSYIANDLLSSVVYYLQGMVKLVQKTILVKKI